MGKLESFDISKIKSKTKKQDVLKLQKRLQAIKYTMQACVYLSQNDKFLSNSSETMLIMTSLRQLIKS